MAGVTGGFQDAVRLRDWLAVGLLSALLGGLLCLPAALGLASGAPAMGGVALDAISDTSQGVAATVDGVPVGEAVVTSYVMHYREAHGLVDDETWAQWFGENEMTAESVRSDTVDFYTSLLKLRLAAREQGVVVSQDEVDSTLVDEKASIGSEEDWTAALASAGVTEELERLILESKLLQVKLADEVASSDVDDDTVMAYVELLKGSWEGELPDEMATLDQVPENLALTAREQAETEARDNSFHMWVYQWMADVEVVKNDMPSGLPYDVEPIAPTSSAELDGGDGE